MKISDLILKEEAIVYIEESDIEISNITLYPDEIKPGCLFIILNSEKFDCTTAFKELPSAIVCDVNCVLPNNIPTIRVENPRLIMARAYYRFEGIDKGKFKIIGITGTNGKSSTAILIKRILMECGHKVGYIGTGKIEINERIISDHYYSMTTPDPALLYKTLKEMETCGCDTVVMEVSSHSLALHKLEPLSFDYAIFTNLSSEHLDFHKSKKEYFASKLKLFNQCKCGIFNIDDESARQAYKLCKSRRISAGIIWRGDVWASNIENKGIDGIGYIYHGQNFSFKMNLKLSGVYNTYNSMLAATVCIDMGCKPCEVKRILNNVRSIPGRFEIINKDISVIIDYAHTDSAFDNIMKELFLVKADKKLTVVFGCGGNRDKDKRPKMAALAEKYANRVIVTSDNSRNESISDIIADIIRGFKHGKYEIIENRRDAIRAAILCAGDGEVVAIIGKGPETYNIDMNGYSVFNEKEIVLSAMEERKAIR
jgi:UDP-N-acetylmuramoyl-L-alanyl-D-glutamate--2,6-diaminopimelate ligase